MKASDLLKAADTHANRPAANAVPTGGLYSCTTHNLIYRTDGSTWSTWATLGGTTTVATDAIWDTKGDLAIATGADAAAKLVVGSNGQVLTADSTQTTGVKWATGGGGGITPGRAKAKRTAGNVTLNSTTFVNIDTATDLVIAAAAGDVLEVTMAVRASTAGSNIYCVLDFHTIVSSAPVNSIAADAAAGTTNVGFPAWSTGVVRAAGSGYTHFVGTKQYTVQAGDISGGNVTLRLRGFDGGSVTLDASTDPYLYIAVVNLKQ